MVFQSIFSKLKYISFRKISFNDLWFSYRSIRNLILVAIIFVDLTMLIKQELGTRFWVNNTQSSNKVINTPSFICQFHFSSCDKWIAYSSIIYKQQGKRKMGILKYYSIS